ncbi:MAG: metallophosphoesterase [Acutalibacteraceae bacterium]|nr:metallophosphoesterase [Acutalibacteraceae bacterium]
MLKKSLSIILSLTLVLCSCLVLTASAKNDSDKFGFAVASDTHYVHPVKQAGTTLADEGWVTTFNSESESLTNQSGFIIDEFLKECAENPKCQFVLITGDLATHGRDYVSEHEAVAAKFRKFEKETGKQVYVINGNHDNAKDMPVDHKKFTEIYHEFGYDEALSTDEGTCSYSANLNDEYTLVALDTCDERYRVVPNNDITRMDWAVKQIKAAKKQGKKVIMIMHHNLLEHNPFQKLNEKNYVVNTPYSFAGLLADLGVKLVFSGHTHCNNVKSYTSFLGNTIYDFSMSSLGNFPAEYKYFNVTDSKISYETKKINHIDADKLAEVCKGFSNEALEMMKNNLQTYTWSMSYREYSEDLRENISPETLGVEESSALYAKLKPVTDTIKEMSDTPIYGKGGIQEQAAAYGLEIPDSEYKTLNDAMTLAILRCKIGDKRYNLNSNDFMVLIRLLAFTVRKSIAATADSDILSGANEMLGKLGYKGSVADNMLRDFSEKYGFATPEEKEALAIAYGLWGGYFSDVDGVENRDGAIPGYAVKEANENQFIVMAKKLFKLVIDLLNKIIISFYPVFGK